MIMTGAKCCDPVPRVNTDVTKCSVTAEQPEARCSALQQLKVRTVTAALQHCSLKQRNNTLSMWPAAAYTRSTHFNDLRT